MSDAVLLLDADFSPLRVLALSRAMGLLLTSKARQVVAYDGREVRSPSVRLPWPAVVHLVRYAGRHGHFGPTRHNVFARDGFACAYCGDRPGLSALTLDHVVPRSRAVAGRVVGLTGRSIHVNGWANLVAACVPCNQVKGARTPVEAGLLLGFTPGAPTRHQSSRLLVASRRGVPREWRAYL